MTDQQEQQTPPVTTTEPPADTLPGGVPDPVPPVPQTFEPVTAESLKLPEGFSTEGEALPKFLEFVNENKLPPAAAESLLAQHAELVKAAVADVQKTYAEQNAAEWQKLQETWLAEAKKMPDIGGDKMDQTLSVVAKALDKFGTKGARDAFDLTGAGNHPEIIRFVHAMASKLVEAPPVSGGPLKPSQSIADRLYPSTQS